MPPTVVWYCRHPPVLLGAEGRPIVPLTADPRLFEAARRLATLADFFVIPSNATHLFQAEIAAAAGIPLVSMIEITAEFVRLAGWRRAGVLGLGEPVVHTRPLGALGIDCEIIDGDARAALDTAIIKLQEGREDDASRAAAHDAVEALRRRGVDGIILGCTEIPLLLGAAADAPDLLNPSQLLAEAAVREALR